MCVIKHFFYSSVELCALWSWYNCTIQNDKTFYTFFQFLHLCILFHFSVLTDGEIEAFWFHWVYVSWGSTVLFKIISYLPWHALCLTVPLSHKQIFRPMQVAKVVEECMHNYLMYEHLLQVSIVPPEKVHPSLWVHSLTDHQSCFFKYSVLKSIFWSLEDLNAALRSLLVRLSNQKYFSDGKAWAALSSQWTGFTLRGSTMTRWTTQTS